MPKPSPDEIPSELSDFTPSFLTRVLEEGGDLHGGRVTGCRVEIIGEGHGFAGEVARLHLEYEGEADGAPATLIAKLPSRNVETRAIMEAVWVYDREVSFFQHAADRSKLAIPRCYYAAMDVDPAIRWREAGTKIANRIPVGFIKMIIPVGKRLLRSSGRRYAILLEDIGGLRNGDQIEGAGLAEGERCARALAEFHASYWQSDLLDDAIWLPRTNTMSRTFMAAHRRGIEGYRNKRSSSLPTHYETARSFVDENFEGLMDRVAGSPYTLLHGDYRMDNLFFDDQKVWAVDFQVVMRGRAGFDLGNFLATNLRQDVDEMSVVKSYWNALTENGIEGYEFNDCHHDYVIGKLYMLYMMISADEHIDFGEGRGLELQRVSESRLFSRIPEPPYDWLLQAPG